MTIRQKVEVELEDGTTHELVVDGRDLRAWEAWKGEAVFTSPTSLTKLTEYAYLSGRRNGLWNGTYEDWEPQVVGADLKGAVEGSGNPTQTDRGDDSSSPSPSGPTSARASGKKQGKKQS